MQILKQHWIVCAFILGTALTPQMGFSAGNCKNVSGHIVETLLPFGAPNDPLGRVLGTVTGVLNGSKTAILDSLVPGPGGVLTATTKDIFVTNTRDLLWASGVAVFTPIPGQPPGFFTDDLTLTIVGGSGKFEGATGTIKVVGRSENLFSPNPGDAFFDLDYRGEVCQ
jgi:hypothetical protein